MPVIEKPKFIKILIILWIIIAVCFAVHCWHFYIAFFVWEFRDFYSILYFIESHMFFESHMFLVASIVIIDGIYAARKWSWLVNVLFSFYFLLYYGRLFFHSIIIVVFLSEYRPWKNYLNTPSYIGLTVASLIIAPVMFFIFILLFKPSVKEYFNQN